MSDPPNIHLKRSTGHTWVDSGSFKICSRCGCWCDALSNYVVWRAPVLISIPNSARKFIRATGNCNEEMVREVIES